MESVLPQIRNVCFDSSIGVGGGWNLKNGMCSFWKNVMYSCKRPLIPQGYRTVTICPAIYGEDINI